MVLPSAHALVGNPAVLKQVNLVRLLRQLRLHGPASRALLSRASGLDAKTITNLSGDLLKQRLIREMETVRGGRGRPATYLALNHEAAYAIGVDVGAQQCTAVTIDFSGQAVRKNRRDFGQATGMEALLHQVEVFVHEHLGALTAQQRKRMKGLGITFPGLLDREHGTIISCVNIPNSWDVPVVERLEGQFGMAVHLEEASRSMARAELWYDASNHPENFIVVDVGYGVGLGIIIGGRLFRGVNEKCGEIGHIHVASPGLRCRCGNDGCLETVAGGHALSQQMKRLGVKKHQAGASDAAAFFAMARQGHDGAQRILGAMAQSLGIAIATVINLFDPGCVILNGQLILADDYLLTGIIEAVHKHALKSTACKTVIRKTNLDLFSGALGAAMLPLLRYFQMDNIDI